MDRQQREYFLREQMRAIQKELGEGSAEETLCWRDPAENRRRRHAGGRQGESAGSNSNGWSSNIRSRLKSV